MDNDASRIALPDDSEIDALLSEDLRSMKHSGLLINVHRALLRSPEIAAHVIGLGATQFAAGSLTDTDREMVILTCGHLYQSPYEAAQHEPISRAVGVTDEQRTAIQQQAWRADCFTAAQQALLIFAARVALNSQVDNRHLADVRAHYSDQQVVEAIILVGYYFLIARVTTVLDVPIDAPNDDSVLRAGQAIYKQSRL
jgi:4-carboxymuconolactone decarboxylase